VEECLLVSVTEKVVTVKPEQEAAEQVDPRQPAPSQMECQEITSYSHWRIK